MPDRAEALRQATALVEAVLKAPNQTFAVGLVLMYHKAILEKAVELVEAEHRQKQPLPSGANDGKS